MNSPSHDASAQYTISKDIPTYNQSTTQQYIMSTGLPDSAIRDAHDMIHHAEQEEHEHEAAAKRGLPDKAVEAEHEFMQHAEDELDEFEVRDSKYPLL